MDDAALTASRVTMIDAETVERLIPPASLLEPLRAAFAGGVVAPARTTHAVGDAGDPADLLMMPAWSPGKGLGIKLATVTRGNIGRGLPSIDAAYLMFTPHTHQLQAVIDGTALTEMRTAALSLLGRTLLAPQPAETMLMVGAGALASHLVRAHARLSPLSRIQIWNRSSARAQALAEQLAADRLPVAVVSDLEQAARSADLICSATNSRNPLIRGEWLKDGMHLSLIGSYRPDMIEVDAEAMAAGGVAVDIPDAIGAAGELVGPIASGAIAAADIPDLAALLGGARPKPGRISIFKSIGSAIADLAAALALLERFKAAR